MDSDKSQMNFGNTLDEIKYIRSVLSEIGPEPTDAEIDRAITLAKVDMFQEKMEKFYDPEMCPNSVLKNKWDFDGSNIHYFVNIFRTGFLVSL